MFAVPYRPRNLTKCLQIPHETKVYGNTMEDCRAYGVKIMASPQGKICDNDIELPEGEDADDVSFCTKNTG